MPYEIFEDCWGRVQLTAGVVGESAGLRWRGGVEYRLLDFNGVVVEVPAECVALSGKALKPPPRPFELVSRTARSPHGEYQDGPASAPPCQSPYPQLCSEGDVAQHARLSWRFARNLHILEHCGAARTGMAKSELLDILGEPDSHRKVAGEPERLIMTWRLDRRFHEGRFQVRLCFDESVDEFVVA